VEKIMPLFPAVKLYVKKSAGIGEKSAHFVVFGLRTCLEIA